MVDPVNAFLLLFAGAVFGILAHEAFDRLRGEPADGMIKHRWRCDGCGNMHRWSWPEEDLYTNMKTWLGCERCDSQTLAVWEGGVWRKTESRDRRAAFHTLKGPGAGEP